MRKGPNSNEAIRIAFMGDVNPGGVLTFTGGVSEEIIQHLEGYDLRIANLESAIGERPFSEKKMADPNKAYIIFSPDESVDILRKVKLDAVTLANNHASDCGLEGLSHTMQVLSENGIRHLGAGNNISEAKKALILEVKGKRIAFLSYGKPLSFIHVASQTEGGINPIHAEHMLSDIRGLKASCDYVIVLPHWGKEKTLRPKRRDAQLARRMIKAGACAVIGSHTHTVQPCVHFRRGVIAMSLGNFIFPDRYICYPKVTCYPTKEERQKPAIPVTYAFPLVHELTLKRMPDNLRIGMILDMELRETGIRFRKHYTLIDKDNQILFKDISRSMRIKLWAIGCLMKLHPYLLIR